MKINRMLMIFFLISGIFYSVVLGNFLKISEIFFDGNDERVEITNVGSGVFSGQLVLSGAKATPVVFSSTIEVGSSVILGDTMSRFIDFSNVLFSGVALNIADTAPINLSLFYSGTLMDSLYVATSTVLLYDNQQKSFEILYDSGSFLLTATDNTRIYNISSQRIANPGKMFSLSGGQSGQQQGGTMYSGSIKITEVFFEGPNEWIEISHLGTGFFSGIVNIVGVKNGTLSVLLQLSGGESVVIADNGTGIVNQQIIIATGMNLVLPDDGDINILMSYSGIVIDTFDVEETLVLPYIDGSTSFERVWFNNELVITATTGSRIFNVTSGYVANPGKIFSVITPVVILDDNGTGFVIQQNTGICFSGYSIIQISEIHPYVDSHPVYVEILVTETFSGIIHLQTPHQSGSRTILIDSPGSTRHLLASSIDGFVDTGNVIVLSGLGGFQGISTVSIIGQSGQVFDNVQFGDSSSGKSLYFRSDQACYKDFFTIKSISPGFSEVYLTENLIITPPPSCPVCQSEPIKNPSVVSTGQHVEVVSTLSGCKLETGSNMVFYSGFDQEGVGLKIVHIVYQNKIMNIGIKNNSSGTQSLNKKKISFGSRSFSLSGNLSGGMTKIYSGITTSSISGCVILSSGKNQLDNFCLTIKFPDSVIKTGTVKKTTTKVTKPKTPPKPKVTVKTSTGDAKVKKALKELLIKKSNDDDLTKDIKDHLTKSIKKGTTKLKITKTPPKKKTSSLKPVKKKVYKTTKSAKNNTLEELKIYRNYVKETHGFMRKNWKIFFDNTDYLVYNNILQNSLDALKQKKYFIEIDAENIAIDNIKKLFELEKKSFNYQILLIYGFEYLFVGGGLIYDFTLNNWDTFEIGLEY